MFEIFCGTKSVGKVVERLKGWSVVSLDNRPETNPTILVNILDWDYKRGSKLPSGLPLPVPDFIWFSIPCTTFSLLAGGKHRTKDQMEGKTEEAREGLEIVRKCLEIIRYFTKLNPRLRWVIENPKGLLFRLVVCCFAYMYT